MRFIADAMLGKLARWLRIFGYDTVYNPQLNDAELVRIARAEERTLLTRDVQLSKRVGVQVTLIEHETLVDQLTQLSRQGAITVQKEPRCPKCNTLLLPLSKIEAWNNVPLYVFTEQTDFNHCPGCDSYYWPGTQWQRIRATLNSISRAVEDQPNT